MSSTKKVTLKFIGDAELEFLKYPCDLDNLNIYDQKVKAAQQETFGDHVVRTVCVGDFGFNRAYLWLENQVDPEFNMVIQGNHDDYSYQKLPHVLGDFGMYIDKDDPNCRFFFVRGAESRPNSIRKMGVDLFEEEQLTDEQLSEGLGVYLVNRPDVVVSHECPQIVRERLFGIDRVTRTSSALQGMFDQHKPKIWIFGHHHQNVAKIIDGTLFICLETGSEFNLNF